MARQLHRAEFNALRHGYARKGQVTRLHSIWRGMKKRCSTTVQNVRHDYGGRGIRVCSDWQRFEAFRDWAESSGYNDSLSIERIDPDGNYEPTNCRWTDATGQARNRRTTNWVEAFGERLSLAAWSERTGIAYTCLKARLKKGWTSERALTEPSRKALADRYPA